MDLSTIAEEDGDSVVSGSTAKPNARRSPSSVVKVSTASEGSKDKERKKKKKAKIKDAAADYDYDTAQQILIDMCKEMRDLKEAMQEGQKKATENLDSNRHVLTQLEVQMGLLQRNMKQLDQVIESKITPKQIEDLARIRAVQEIIKTVKDDKDRTVGVYEEHARRDNDEIQRLRQDLVSERGEVAALRAELEVVRGERQRMLATGLKPANNICINTDDCLGWDSDIGSTTGPGASYINGATPNGGFIRKSMSGLRGDNDDMTLLTKESYETSAYETKSLKKRIIHMKKKLTVAQLEAKETGKLRLELEKLRVDRDTEKKSSLTKDETIKRLEVQIQDLRCSTARPSTSSPKSTTARTPPQSTEIPSATQGKKAKWWDI